MAITNNFSGFNLYSTDTNLKRDRDSDFGTNLNRSISALNSTYSTAGITNSYSEGYSNQFGASSHYSGNEQRMLQSMIKESINVNGITVRYMPRKSDYTDELLNEQPESVFERGLQMDMLLVSATGFEGEGDVMLQYGIEFREEVLLSVAIPRFEELYRGYSGVPRLRPLEGDLIVIPFGRTSDNNNQYIPKIFEITRVTTYHDGAFFQMGDNYQYKIRARLFELSGEDLEFNPKVTRTTLQDSEIVVSGDSDSKIYRATNDELVYDVNGEINITKDSELHLDSWADNNAIEKESQEQAVYNSSGVSLKDPKKVITTDYTARAFGYGGVINNLDDI